MGEASARFSPYAALPVGTNEGVFDDFSRDSWQAVYGATAIWQPSGVLEQLKLYLNGFYDESSRFVTQVQGSERRETLGAQAKLRAGPTRAAFEAILQLGETEGLDIFAWLLAAQLGVEMRVGGGVLSYQPVLEIGRGDDDPTDGVLGSFNAFFPYNRYYGGTGVIGAFSNSVHLFNTLAYRYAGWRAQLELEQFWRVSTRDIVYNPAGFPGIVVPGSDEAFVGHQIDLQFVWALHLNVETTLRFAHFFAGDYPQQRAGVRDTTYFSTVWWEVSEARARRGRFAAAVAEVEAKGGAAHRGSRPGPTAPAP